MDETKGFTLIKQAVHAALTIDVLLVLFNLMNPEPLTISICVGVFVAQCGLCCAAFLRNDNLREESISLFIYLVACGFLATMIDQQMESGYVLAGIFIGTMIGVVIHLLPVRLLRLFLQGRRPQFSILKIMILTALFGGLAGFVRWGGEFALTSGVVALVTVLMCFPSALACWLLNFTQQTKLFLPIMLVVAAIIICFVAWLPMPERMPAAGFLLAQILGSTIGGVILLQVKPSPEPVSAQANVNVVYDHQERT